MVRFTLATAVVVLALAPLSAQTNPVDGSGLYKQTLPGVAWVVTERRDGAAFSTAWVADAKNRLLVTNNHVVDRSTKLRVYFPQMENGKTVAEREWYERNGTAFPAEVVAADPKCDLAVIQVEKMPEGVKELKLAAGGPEPGSVVHTIGNSGSSPALWVFTSSNVRQVYRSRFRGFDGVVVETSLATDKGASGSPVLNPAGEVVAVVYAQTDTGRLVTLSVDASEVKTILKTAGEELASGKPRKPKADPADETGTGRFKIDLEPQRLRPPDKKD